MSGIADQSMILQRKKLLAEIADLEEEAAKSNSLKVNSAWRDALTQDKLRELKEESEFRAVDFSRKLEYFDSLIQQKARDLEEADEEDLLRGQNHDLHVKELIQIHKERMDALEHEFHEDLDTLTKEFETEKESIEKRIGRSIAEFAALAQMGDEEHEKRMQAELDTADQEFEGVRSLNMEKEHEVVSHLQAVLAAIKERCTANLTTYRNQTEAKSLEYAKGLARDEEQCAEVERELRIVDRLSRTVNNAKMKERLMRRDLSTKNENIQDEYRRLLNCQMALRSIFRAKREQATVSEAELAAAARNCRKKLQSHLDLAERILNKSQLCRKLETERERTIPLYGQTSMEDLAAAVAKYEQQLSALKAQQQQPNTPSRSGTGTPQGNQPTSPLVYSPDILLQEVPMAPIMSTDFLEPGSDERSYLDNFFKRYNKVLLDKLALDREQRELLAKNSQLKSLVNQFLEGVSISDRTFADPTSNSVLIVNNQLRLNAAGQQALSQVTSPRSVNLGASPFTSPALSPSVRRRIAQVRNNNVSPPSRGLYGDDGANLNFVQVHPAEVSPSRVPAMPALRR